MNDPAPKRSSTGWIIAAVGCGGLMLFTTALVAFFAIWQFLSPAAGVDAGTSSEAGAAVEMLTQRYVARDGSVAMNYPASFAASTPAENNVIAQRTEAFGAEFVTVEAVGEPISTDLDELERVVQLDLAKKLPGYVKGITSKAVCHGETGRAATMTYEERGVLYEIRSCSFLSKGHYHRCSYAAPKTELASEEPLLKNICESVELLK